YEMRILVALRNGIHRDVIAPNFACNSSKVFGGCNDIQLALRSCRHTRHYHRDQYGQEQFGIHKLKPFTIELERVSAMRSNRKLKLKQKFVGKGRVCVSGAPILGTHLTEFAWPVGQNRRLPFVDERGILSTSGAVVTETGKPSPSKLVITRDVVAARMLHPGRLRAAAPNEFRAAYKGAVNRPLQGAPTDRGVRTPQRCPKTAKV